MVPLNATKIQNLVTNNAYPGGMSDLRVGTSGMNEAPAQPLHQLYGSFIKEKTHAKTLYNSNNKAALMSGLGSHQPV